MPTPVGPTVGLPTPTPTPSRKGDTVALFFFIVLVVLGMIAAGLSFARM
ncbi:hypothetical protein [Rubrivirga sp. SAORIC476]|nr:hypothetical protein [Rubrivirga sp. SAORIC476]